MSTHFKKNPADLDIEDFRRLIAAHVLKRHEDGALIVAKDSESGRTEEWMFDFRAVALSPAWIGRYADIFWDLHASEYPFQVGGMETGGIPLVAAIVMKGIERGTPVNGFYIRKSRKRDGLMKIVEGEVTDHPVILVDDLIHSGQTFQKQILTLEASHLTVREIFTVIAYRDASSYRFATDRGIAIRTLFTLEDFGIPLRTVHAPSVPDTSLSVVWQFQSPQPSHFLVVAKSVPALDSDRLYMGFDDGVFRAFDKRTGSLAWDFKIGSHMKGKGILSSPCVYEDSVFFGAYDGTVYALDARSGKKIWQFDEADWVGSSPCIDSTSGRLYIGLEFGLFKKRGAVVSLDAKSGKKIWEHRTEEFTHASPIYLAEEALVVCGSNDGVVAALECETGAIRWRRETGAHIKSACGYDASRGLVVAASMDGTVYGLSARDGSIRFAKETDAGVYGTPLIENGIIYVASLDKSLYALDADTGKQKWSFATRGRIFCSPLIADGSLWIGSNDGILYELDATRGSVKSVFQSPEKMVSKPVFDVTTGYLYATTHANEIYCLKRIETI